MPNRAMHPIMDKTVSTTSYAASGATAAGGFFSLNEWALILGILFAALTAAINWWYQRRKDRRDAEHLHAVVELERQYKAAHDAREMEYHELRKMRFMVADEASGD
jgi:hypothetical protein